MKLPARRTTLLAFTMLTLGFASQLRSAELAARYVWDAGEQISFSNVTDTVESTQVILNDAGQVLQRARTSDSHKVGRFSEQRLNVLLFHDVSQPSQVIAYDTEEAAGLLPLGYILPGGLDDGRMNLANDGTISLTCEVVHNSAGFYRALFQGNGSTGVSLQVVENSTFNGQTVTGISYELGGNNDFVTLDLETDQEDAIYQGSIGSIARVAGTQDVSPIAGQAITGVEIFPDEPDDNGHVSRNGNMVYHATTVDGSGYLFFNDGSGPVAVVEKNQALYGNGLPLEGKAFEGGFNNARVGNNGHILGYSGGSLLWGTAGNMKSIATRQDHEGLEDIPNHTDYYWDDIDTDAANAVVLDNGDAIFHTRIFATDGPNIRNGIFRYDSSEDRVVSEVFVTKEITLDLHGEQLTGTLTAQVSPFYAANEAGHIAFVNDFTWEDPLNPGTNLTTGGLMLLSADTGEFEMLVEVGVDKLDFGSGFEVVSSVAFPTGVQRDDPSYHFNANGELLFTATSQSGQSAMFVLAAATVPEPTSVVLLAIAAVAVAGRRRQS